MGESWYFGGNELLLVSDNDDISGYDSLNISGEGLADEDDE